MTEANIAEIAGKITRETIRRELYDMQDEEYQQFQSGLVPGEKTIIGVRTPLLRRYAKELTARWDGGVDRLLETVGDELYEEIMLQGMIIGAQKKIPVETLFARIEAFVPKINNWAVCDVFCGGLKEVKKYRAETYDFLQRFLDSGEEFSVRFGLVMLLSYYIDEEYLDRVLAKTAGVTHPGYYVKMAAAWLFSICLVKFYDRTLPFLQKSQLDDFTYNKALQKARESHRTTEEQRAELKQLQQTKQGQTQKGERKDKRKDKRKEAR